MLLAACIVFTAAPFGMRPIFNAKVTTPQDSAILFDLAGISVKSGINVFRQFAPDEPPLQPKPEDCYNAHQSDPFLWGPCKNYEDLLNRHRDKVFVAWFGAIATHPWAYVLHRAAFAKALPGASSRGNRMVVPPPPFDLATNGPAFIGEMPENMRPGWRSGGRQSPTRRSGAPPIPPFGDGPVGLGCGSSYLRRLLRELARTAFAAHYPHPARDIGFRQSCRDQVPERKR